jgi:hypothetical protein
MPKRGIAVAGVAAGEGRFANPKLNAIARAIEQRTAVRRTVRPTASELIDDAGLLIADREIGAIPLNVARELDRLV